MGSRFRQRTRSAAIVSFSLQLTSLACRSSLNVDRQVFLGRPLFLLPSAGVHSTALYYTDWAKKLDCFERLQLVHGATRSGPSNVGVRALWGVMPDFVE